MVIIKKNVCKNYKNYFFIIWTLYCIIGISKNFKHYSFLDWIIIILFSSIPYIIIHILNKSSKNTSKKQKHTINTSVIKSDVSDDQNNVDKTVVLDKEITYTLQDTQQKSLVVKKVQPSYPKCNCDGCYKQQTCTYGHMIYDEYTHERMTLADKFIMLTAFNNTGLSVDSEFDTEIIPDECLYDVRKLLNYSKAELVNTLSYLQEQKKKYKDFGKCGRNYFNFMKMNNSIEVIKKAIKEKKGNF